MADRFHEESESLFVKSVSFPSRRPGNHLTMRFSPRHCPLMWLAPRAGSLTERPVVTAGKTLSRKPRSRRSNPTAVGHEPNTTVDRIPVVGSASERSLPPAARMVQASKSLRTDASRWSMFEATSGLACALVSDGIVTFREAPPGPCVPRQTHPARSSKTVVYWTGNARFAIPI